MSHCTAPGFSVGSGGGVDKILIFRLKFLCDGQGAVRPAIIYEDRSCFSRQSFLSSFSLPLGDGQIQTEILSKRAIKQPTNKHPLQWGLLLE